MKNKNTESWLIRIGIRLGLIVRIALDPGTGNTVMVRLKRNGEVDLENIFDQPTVVMINRDEAVAEFGDRAKRWIDRLPSHGHNVEGYRILQPIVDGLIQHPKETALLWRKCLDKFRKDLRIGRWRPLHLMITVPIGLTELQEMILTEVAQQAGARSVRIAKQVFCAIHGDFLYAADSPEPNFGIDIGHGTEQLLLFNSLQQFPACAKSGGSYYTEDLQQFFREEKLLEVDALQAELLKIRSGAAMLLPEEDDPIITVPGRELAVGEGIATGSPINKKVRRSELVEAFQWRLKELVRNIRQVCLQPETGGLAADFVNDEKHSMLILAGGGTLLHNLDKYLAQELGFKVVQVSNPLRAIAVGAARVMADPWLRRFFSHPSLEGEFSKEEIIYFLPPVKEHHQMKLPAKPALARTDEEKEKVRETGSLEYLKILDVKSAIT